MNNKFYYRAISIVRPLMKFFYPFEIRGKENIENAECPYIICSNHLSNLDPAFLMLIHKEPIRFMAKQELFKNRILNWIFTKMGAFEVKRGKGDKSALVTSENILKSGEVLGIFVEGTRSKTGEFLRAKSGATLIAASTSAKILPVCITGTGKNNKVRMFHKTIISYGNFIMPEDLGYEAGSRASLKIATEKIMDNIKSLRTIKE